MVLLLGAGLLMRTFVNLVRTDLGLDPKNVLVAGIAFAPQEQLSPESQLATPPANRKASRMRVAIANL